MSSLKRTPKPKVPTSYYVVVLSTVVHAKDGQFVAVVTDMPVREVGATKDEAIKKAQRAALRMMAVAAASIEGTWRVLRSMMQAIDKRVADVRGADS